MDKNKLKDSAIIGASAAVGSGVSSYVTAELLERETEEPESGDSVRVDAANGATGSTPDAEVDVITVEPARPVEPANHTEPVNPSEPTGPVDLSEPTEPVNPSEPAGPTGPVNPVPAEPVGPAVAAVYPEVPVSPDEDIEPEPMYGGPGMEMMYGGPEIDEDQIDIDIEPDIYGGPVDEISPLDDTSIYC